MDSFRRGMDAFGRGDVEAALEDIHPEIEFIPMRAAVQGAFHGHEGMRSFFRGQPGELRELPGELPRASVTSGGTAWSLLAP